MQDFEFTVEDGRLYMLQARSGKRTRSRRCASRHCEDHPARRGSGAARRRDAAAIEVDELAPLLGTQPIARCVPASAEWLWGWRVRTGRVEDFKRKGDAVVLLREHTETADIEARADGGTGTAHGARTSHAAVVARQLGKVCLVGCYLLKIDAGGAAARSAKFLFRRELSRSTVAQGLSTAVKCW